MVSELVQPDRLNQTGNLGQRQLVALAMLRFS